MIAQPELRVNELRRGVTLIELLIVMAVVVLLAGISLPAIKNTMKDHRTSEATRLVQGFLEACRAKAIAANRPVAAILERVGTSNLDTVGLGTCSRMSMGEVFPPYEGDWANSSGTLGDSDSDGFVDNIQIPLAQASVLSRIITDGDTIELGKGNYRFRVLGAPLSLPASPPLPDRVQVNFVNPTMASGVAIEEARWPIQAGTSKIAFRIYRKPSKTMSGTVALPRGTCIDLAQSGFGPSGLQLATSTASIASYRSIYIIFNARGAVETVYEVQQDVTGATGPAIATGMMQLGQLHLLVGKTDQVNTASGPVSTRDDFLSNLADTSNKWVSINTFNGLVHSSDVAPIVAAPAVMSARALATRHATAKE